jgi:hypothetical protein
MGHSNRILIEKCSPILIRCDEKKNLLSVKLLPKKPTRTLRNTLQNLYEKIYMTHWSEKGKRDAMDADAALDKDFKIKKKEVSDHLNIYEILSAILIAVSLMGSYFWSWISRKRF